MSDARPLTAQLPRPLRAMTPDQICFIVPDLDSAVSGQVAFSGVTFDYYDLDAGASSALRHRGAAATLQIRYALSRAWPQIELIEPLRGPSIYEEHISEHGYGFHHLGYVVSELELHREQMARVGQSPLFEGLKTGVSGDGGFAYYDTRAELGHLVELILQPTQRVPPTATVTAATISSSGRS